MPRHTAKHKQRELARVCVCVYERGREREKGAYSRFQIHQDSRFCGLFGTIKLNLSN